MVSVFLAKIDVSFRGLAENQKYNGEGMLGLGDSFNRGDDANGPCLPISTA